MENTSSPGRRLDKQHGSLSASSGRGASAGQLWCQPADYAVRPFSRTLDPAEIARIHDEDDELYRAIYPDEIGASIIERVCWSVLAVLAVVSFWLVISA